MVRHDSMRQRLTLAVLLISMQPTWADDGQAQAVPGARLAGLQIGTVLHGSDFDPEDHLGEVVVVNIGGG